MMDWPELDALLEEVRTQNEETWQRAQDLRRQLGQLQPQLEIIARQYEDLQVHGLLQALNERLLGGLGTIELVHSGVGIEYLASLVWPAHMDPRGAAQDSDEGGLHRIDIWLGPGLQDGRARIRIAGAKRLEAVLPTNSERLRAALLSVFRNPQYVPRPDAGDASEHEAADAETGVTPEREEEQAHGIAESDEQKTEDQP